MRTMKFCSAVFGVMSRLSVTNKIHRLHGAVYVVRRPQSTNAAAAISAIIYTLPSKRWWHSTVQQWSIPKPYIGRKSRFCHSYRGSVWYGKTKMVWLPHGEKKNWRYVYSFRQNTRTWRTDGRTDIARQHRQRSCIASRGKNMPTHCYNQYAQLTELC